jgi:signal peptide peptidase SppA
MTMKTTLTKQTRNSLLAMLTWQPLAMSKAGLNAMLAALEMAEPSALWANPGDAANRSGTTIMRDGVAVITIHGPIFAGAGWLSAVFDLADPQQIALDLVHALDDPKVNAVLLEVNSPGGQITGVNELSQMIREARGQKPIVAYVSGSAASAAYWIASGADEIVMEETSSAGSLGVIVRYPKKSQNDYAVEIISSASPKKRVDPESDEGRAQILAYADTLAEVFLSTVAENRGVSIETVKTDFGQGDMLVGKQAVDAGLADSVGTFEALMERLSTSNSNTRRTTMDKTAITTIIQLAAAYPELVAQMQQAAREEGVKSVDVVGAGNDAAGKERTRILGLAAIQFGVEASDKLKAVVVSGVTVEQFQAITALNPPAKEIKTKGDETREKLLSALEQSGAVNPGAGGGDNTTGGKDFIQMVEAYRFEHKCTKAVAMQAIRAQHPEAHEAWLKKANQG